MTLIKVLASIGDAALLECVTLDDIQIASALEAKGVAPVDLDELDLWSFEIETESKI